MDIVNHHTDLMWDEWVGGGESGLFSCATIKPDVGENGEIFVFIVVFDVGGL